MLQRMQWMAVNMLFRDRAAYPGCRSVRHSESDAREQMARRERSGRQQRRGNTGVLHRQLSLGAERRRRGRRKKRGGGVLPVGRLVGEVKVK